MDADAICSECEGPVFLYTGIYPYDGSVSPLAGKGSAVVACPRCHPELVPPQVLEFQADKVSEYSVNEGGIHYDRYRDLPR